MIQFTLEQEQRIIELYKSGKITSQIARIMHRSKYLILRVLHKNKVMLRQENICNYTPTEEEIRKSAEEIQVTWDDDTRKRRARGEEETSWEVPTISAPETLHRRTGCTEHGRIGH